MVHPLTLGVGMLILSRLGGKLGNSGQAKAKDNSQQKLSGIGATEEQMDMKGTVPQRVDRKGTKIEDEAGTGQHDSSGG